MSPPPRTAAELRQSWFDLFAARAHTIVPSASVIPIDRTVLFTVAGMVPLKPYFVGDETPPYTRAVSIQPVSPPSSGMVMARSRPPRVGYSV